MFHPQTTEIQPFKVKCFSTKMLKCQQYGVIIYDVSADFEILFGMWNSLVMSYPCEKFHHHMTINNGSNCILHMFCFVYFWTNDRGLSIMTSLSMTSSISCKSFFIVELTFSWSIPVQNLFVIGPLTTKIREADAALPPPPPKKNTQTCKEKPSPIRVKTIA